MKEVLPRENVEILGADGACTVDIIALIGFGRESNDNCFGVNSGVEDCTTLHVFLPKNVKLGNVITMMALFEILDHLNRSTRSTDLEQ